MTIQNQSVIDVANTTYRAKFDEIFAARPPGPYDRYTEVIPTDTLVNEVDLLETMPLVRQWTGSKVFQSILASNFTATIQSYERSFEIKRLKLAGDKLGMIGRRISLMMSDAGQIYDNICWSYLVSNPTGYDGVALFSASHPRGPAGGTQSNISATALSFAQHDAIMSAGASLRDANGEPLRIAYDTLIVGPSNKKLGMEITQSKERIVGISNAGVTDAASNVVGGATIPNVYGGGEMELIVDPRFVGSYANKCLYLDSKRGPKPIILYEFRAPEPIQQTDMAADSRFLHDTLRYSVECDVVPIAADWHVAYYINA